MAIRAASATSTAPDLSIVTAQAADEHGSRSSLSASASPPTSTPPTSLGDEASVMSDASKMEMAETREELSTPLDAHLETPSASQSASAVRSNSEPRRAVRNSRKSVVTYNVQILAGTAIHTPTKYLEKHHNNVVHGDIQTVVKSNPTTPKKRHVKRRTKSVSAEIDDPAEQQLAAEAAQAAQRRSSSRVSDLRRVALGNLGGVGEAVANTISGGKGLVKSVLKRSASDSRLRSALQTAAAAPAKRPKTARAAAASDEEDVKDEKVYYQPKTKKWLSQGLYVGQARGFKANSTEARNIARSNQRAAFENKSLPLPLFTTEDQLKSSPHMSYRDFKLPFSVYNPLPRKVKVEGWTKLNKNRFIGDASALWKREKHDDASQCSCEPEDGCGDTCHNRIMAYECDSTNCRLTPDQCNNRPFAQLKKRAKGNGYDYGVEVMETEGKGYGVRAMRCFEPHQIIVEYAGEIITQDECERRMKQVYKKDKCYYLMSFDNKMIIDATRGTIARFVNHSCEPNCEMIKWTVNNEPRMALFAGSRGIMTGEELTYDYNFDPFSLKNIQECRCGTRSCRGVLGPKPKKPINHEEKLLPSASNILAGAKRKLQDVFGSGRAGSESSPSSPRKRHMSSVATTKAKNAMAESEAARDHAQKEAAAHAAQIASRESRAAQRQKFASLTKRAQLLSKANRTAKPNAVRTTKTVLNIKRKVIMPKPGALKPVKSLPGNIRRTATKDTLKKTTKTAVRSITPESSSEEESPNITPASLRSANKKTLQGKNIVKQPKFGKAVKTSIEDSESDAHSEFDEIPETDYELDENVSSINFKGKKRGSESAPRGLHKTGAGVVKNRRRVRDATGCYKKR